MIVSKNRPGMALARNWWALAARGGLAITFGLFAFLLPGATMLSLVFVFAAYALLDGVLAIVAAVRAMDRHERWVVLLLEGVANLVAAGLAVFWPGITVVVFVLLLASWAVITGALMLAAAFRLHMNHGRWWLAIGGGASLLYGVLLFLAPRLGALVLVWWIGAYALLFGVSLILLSLRLRALR